MITSTDLQASNDRPLKWPAESSAGASLKVALVENQIKARQVCSRLIDTFPNFSCVCACATAEEALRLIPALRPDVVLMDIFLSGMSGIECTFHLKELLPNAQIIIFTDVNDRKFVMRAFEAGADGYLLKQTRPTELQNALSSVVRGGVPMTGQIARSIIEPFRRRTAKSVRLTVREEQTLLHLSRGCSNKQIAAKLGVSINTVSSHLKRVFNKLRVSSRTEAVIRYLVKKRFLQKDDFHKTKRNLHSIGNNGL